MKVKEKESEPLVIEPPPYWSGWIFPSDVGWSCSQKKKKKKKKECPADNKQPAMKANTLRADDSEYKYALNSHTLSEESRQKRRRWFSPTESIKELFVGLDFGTFAA